MNVFEDLDIPNAEEHLIKAQLVFKIDTLMKKRRLKQVEAGLYLAFVNLISPRCFAAIFRGAVIAFPCRA